MKAISTALLLAAAATACEPPPPRPTLVVTTTAVGSDASPGDGVCEMTPGAGNCSVQAAFEEGNALGRADIHLATGSYTTPPVTITGDLSLNGTLDLLFNVTSTSVLGGGPIAVASGGSLSVANMALTPQLTVDGVLAARRAYFFWDTSAAFTGPRVQVNAGGLAYFENTIVPHDPSNGQGALDNRGVVFLSYSVLSAHSLQSQPPQPALHNEGAVYSSASYLDGCTGTPPVSRGYNAAPDDSCGLAAPTDIPFVQVPYRDHPSFLKQFFVPLLDASSPLVDAIPAGVNGCGTTVTDDLMRLAPRPYDGDGDGHAACDIGEWELAPVVVP